MLCQTMSLIKNECHVVAYYVFFPKHKLKAIFHLIKVKLFQPGVSKHHTIQLYYDALFGQPSLHRVNPTSLLPCEVWVGVAGS